MIPDLLVQYCLCPSEMKDDIFIELFSTMVLAGKLTLNIKAVTSVRHQ